MCSKFSDRLFIKRNAEKLIFLFAVLTASLVTGIACRHVEAAQRLKLQQHLAGEVLRFHVAVSYTHLDVYKRQLLKCSLRIFSMQ